MTPQVQNGSSPSRGAGWKSLLVALLLLAAIISGLWFWKAQNSASGGWAGGGPVDVTAIRLESQDVPDTLEVPGELEAVQQVMLTAEVSGKVSAIDFSAGQQVNAGDVLVQLDTSVEKADLAAARAREKFTRNQVARARQLAPSGAMTQEELQQRQAEYDQARAQIAQLEARIEQKRIKAPFAGEVGLRHVDLGQYLNPGENAASLTNLSELFVNFDLPQKQRGNISVGQEVELVTDSPEAGSLSAAVHALEPQVNRDTRNLRVQAVMDNSAHQLRPGMYVSVRLQLRTEPDALLLPASAIMTSAYGDTALVVRELNDEQIGKPEFVSVTVSRRIGDQVVISRGLEAGDLVVTEGQLRVQPNSQLRVVSPGADENADEGGQS